MARVTAQQFAQKWQTNLSGATQYIQAGVQKVSTPPGQKAAAQAQVMLANLTAAVTSGMWARRVGAVSLSDWQSAIITKGIPRIASGAQAALAKMTAVGTDLLAAVDASVAIVNQTPRGNLQTNIQRAVTFMTEMNKRRIRRSLT